MTMENGASLDAALNDVFSSGRDRGGNTAPPEVQAPAPAPVATEAAPPAVEPPKTDPDEPSDTNNGRTVPLNEHLSERKKYKSKFEEADRRASTFEAELRTLKEQNQQLLQTFSRPQQAAPAQQRQPVQAPDPWQDPEGAIRHAVGSTQAQLENRLLDMSEYQARATHTDAVVDAAKQAAMQAGIITQFARHPHPYDELVKWHKRYSTMQTVGNDLEAYNKRIEAEVRARVLEELKTGKAPAAPNGQAQQPAPVFPGTLAAATQQGPTGQITKSLEAATGDVFSPDRKVRGMRR